MNSVTRVESYRPQVLTVCRPAEGAWCILCACEWADNQSAADRGRQRGAVRELQRHSWGELAAQVPVCSVKDVSMFTQVLEYNFEVLVPYLSISITCYYTSTPVQLRGKCGTFYSTTHTFCTFTNIILSFLHLLWSVFVWSALESLLFQL